MDSVYEKPLQFGDDPTSCRLLTTDHVSERSWEGRTFLCIEPEGLQLLAKEAMHDLAFYLRPSHQESVARILKDPETADNDQYVARTLLKNSVIAANGVLPICQDTGTAIVVGKKGNRSLREGATRPL